MLVFSKVQMSITIKNIKLGDLIPTQGNLKERTRQDEKKILNSLAENEQMYPLYAAEIDGKYQLIDGHFRRDVLIKTKGKDYEMPVAVFSGMTFEEAKEQCLVLSATYGSIGDLATWLNMELPNLDKEVVRNLNMPLPDLNIDVTSRLENISTKCPICGQ